MDDKGVKMRTEFKNNTQGQKVKITTTIRVIEEASLTTNGTPSEQPFTYLLVDIMTFKDLVGASRCCGASATNRQVRQCARMH